MNEGIVAESTVWVKLSGIKLSTKQKACYLGGETPKLAASYLLLVYFTFIKMNRIREGLSYPSFRESLEENYVMFVLTLC